MLASASLKTTDVRSRVEPEIKESATAVLAECGLSLSDGIRLFLRQVIAQKGLPFDVKVPNAETQAAMAEARALGKTRFGNTAELMRDLDKR
jgi:DNA-damage-inducible protein J